MPKQEGYLKVPGTRNPVLERGPDGRMRKKPAARTRPPETVDGSDRYSDQESTNRDIAQLVWEHLDADSLPAGAGRASSLWEWARKNKDEFFSKFVPMLIRTEQDAAPKWDEKSPCPVCKREPEGVDEGTARALEIGRRWLEETNRALEEDNAKAAAELAARPDGINIAVSLQKELTACLKREARLKRALDDLRAGGEGRIIYTNPEDEALRHPLDRAGWGR